MRGTGCNEVVEWLDILWSEMKNGKAKCSFHENSEDDEMMRKEQRGGQKAQAFLTCNSAGANIECRRVCILGKGRAHQTQQIQAVVLFDREASLQGCLMKLWSAVRNEETGVF